MTFEQRIARLKELESEIAETPWDYAEDKNYDDAYWLFYGEIQTEHGEFGSILAQYKQSLYSPEEGYEFGKKELEYIAHARTVLPELLKRLEKETHE